MENFSERLKRLRKKAGLTQEKLANLIHVSILSVHRWENAERQPRFEDIKKLAQVLHVSEEELLNGEPSQNWVLQIKINREAHEEDFIDMVKGVPCISSVNVTPRGGLVTLGGSYELWNDKKKFNTFIKALTNARKIIVQDAKDLGFFKEENNEK